jgi:hypothetical protein
VIEAFRLGHDARQQAEPSGARAAGWVVGGSRYAVQFVVVDTASGRILGDATDTPNRAADLAGTYNDLDSESVDRPT